MINSAIEQKLKFYRISEEEYEKIKNLLKRELKEVEWSLFSALWSEHCSYKSSKVHLKKFSFRNLNTPDMDGENAGVVDLGQDEKIAFKMESHNHPSFIEPVQGAATGVGGILRDIFTMGARPIMSANYLCFGSLEAPRMKNLMKGVAKGISSYGNCVGVPTVTGQTQLHSRYNQNILVNALNVGYFAPNQKMALSKASGVGNLVVYVGAKTGRDGVHGASMASASFDNDSESKKPNVQIGDPFYEKLLIEACLEVLQQDLVVAMQDMGAAGLTSSSFEMASKGQVGLVIDLKKVPLRDSSMSAEDVLLSESQERMLLICKPENFSNLQKVFKKWSLDAAILGEVQAERKIHLKWGVETLTEIDPDLIVEQAPKYNREYNPWVSKNRVDNLSVQETSIKAQLFLSMSKGLLNSRQWIYNQYDQRVGARTASACDQSVAFARLDHSGRGLALAVGCRPEVMLMDAEIGALDAVYYPSFQMAIKGASVLAITDCLNFGNPQKKEVMSEFVVSVESIAKASKQLNAPVISGNVSFYNETLSDNIISTPATGVVGLRDSVDSILPDQFQAPLESLILVQLNWVQSWCFVENLKEKISKFTLNSEADVVGFIEKSRQLSQKITAENLPVSAIKAVGLGGISATCVKMSTDSIGFDLSYEAALKHESELLKDLFYGFILSTSNRELLLNVLNQYFSDLKFIEIRSVGETTLSKVKFSSQTDFSLLEILNQYRKGL